MERKFDDTDIVTMHSESCMGKQVKLTTELTHADDLLDMFLSFVEVAGWSKVAMLNSMVEYLKEFPVDKSK